MSTRGQACRPGEWLRSDDGRRARFWRAAAATSPSQAGSAEGLKPIGLLRHLRRQCRCTDAADHAAELEVARASRGLTADQGEKARRQTPRRPAPDAADFAPTFKIEYGDGTATVEASALGGPDDAPGILREGLMEAGLNPDEWSTDPDIRITYSRVGTKEGDVVTAVHLKAGLHRRSGDGPLPPDAFALVEQVAAEVRAAPRVKESYSDGWFIVDLGDFQCGKRDDGVGGSDGVRAMVANVLRCLDLAAAEFRERRDRDGVTRVVLAFLGDLCEGVVSQGGRSVSKDSLALSMTSQVMVVFRLVMEAVRLFAPLASEVKVLGVPGNHGEASRQVSWSPNDNWDSCSVALAGAAAEAMGAFPHVQWIVPGLHDVGVVLDLGGARHLWAHGHKIPGKSEPQPTHEWYCRQSGGGTLFGDVDVIHRGHGHRFWHSQWSGVTIVQAPALEQVSEYYRDSFGQEGRPGLVTSVAVGGRLRHVEVQEPR